METVVELYFAWRESSFLLAQVILAIPVAVFLLSLVVVVGKGIASTLKGGM